MIRPSKYRNVRTEVDGLKFASRAEARRYGELKLMQRANLIEDLQLQPRYGLCVNGKLICTYVGDFRYFDRQTKAECLEDAKGMETPVYKLKRKLMQAIYGIEIKEIRYGGRR
jgi:hypothetical protein